MELIKENINVNDIVVNGSTQKTVDGDIIVPDSKPDILKVLQVDSVSCITDKEVYEGGVKIKGRVDLKILYIPDSETECIKSILTTFDFDEDISNKKITQDDSAIINSNVERVEFSLLNSRKLRVKNIVGFDYEIIRVTPLEPTVDVEGDIEIKRNRVSLKNSLGVDDFVFQVRERICVPSGQESINEFLKTDYTIRDVECSIMDGRIMAKGSIGACVLYTDDNNKIQFFEGELPFAEIWNMEDITEDAECEIEYSIEEGEINIEEDTDGDLREVDISVVVTAQVKAWENIEIDMIDDCFVPYQRTKIELEKLIVEGIAARPSSQNTIREIIEVPSSSPSVVSVYNAVTKPYITKVGFENNKLICEGKVEVCVLYVSDSAENPVYSIKKNIPFSYSLDCNISDSDLIPKIKAEIKHTGYNLNATGEIEIRCILMISANVTRPCELKIITNIEVDDNSLKSDSKIVIYFVQSNDTLWNIAKEYGIPCENIREFNNLETDILQKGMRLLIPGK